MAAFSDFISTEFRFTMNRPTGAIKSLSCNVCDLCVCVCVSVCAITETPPTSSVFFSSCCFDDFWVLIFFVGFCFFVKQPTLHNLRVSRGAMVCGCGCLF